MKPKKSYRTHFLKCWPEFFDAIAEERKVFEVRRNDRDFHPRDLLVLREYDVHKKVYTGRETTREVVDVWELDRIGCVGFVVMQIVPPEGG